MAGHSHWANISIKKGIADKKKGKLFGKLSRAIIVAAQHGGGDPDANLKLRYAIDKARQASMPRENIERAVKKGCGDGDMDQYTEILYEGYGPHGVAVLCDILTDNRNRTAGEVRKIFEVNNGNLGATNCVAWMFDRKGLFLIPAQHIEEDKLFDLALEAGADDVKLVDGMYEVLCDPSNFNAIQILFQNQQIPTETAEVTRIAQNTVECDVEQAKAVLKLIDALEDNDDIQNVMTNLNASQEVMEAAVGE